jgi:alcohol dehydrogenase class IV
MGMAGERDSDDLALEKLIEGLRQLNADLSVPGPQACGIEERAWFDSLELMSEQALASGSPANNPRIPDAAEIVELYRRVWG